MQVCLAVTIPRNSGQGDSVHMRSIDPKRPFLTGHEHTFRPVSMAELGRGYAIE